MITTDVIEKHKTFFFSSANWYQPASLERKKKFSFCVKYDEIILRTVSKKDSLLPQQADLI
jgi:hypothetical protein